MEKIILVGHGSPKKSANNMQIVGKLLHDVIHPGCNSDCIMTSYLQFEKPSLEDAIGNALDVGARKVIVHPYFLSAGMHVTSDIPGVIEGFKKIAPEVEFVYTAPLGISHRLVDVIVERIGEANGFKPHEIEEESFRILSEEAEFEGIPKELHPIVKRVVHATADFSFVETMIFHPEALEAGLKAIKAGKNVLTDVEMVRSGINKSVLESWGGKAICKISEATAEGHSTRAETAIEEALDENIGIVAIGNAPTALLKLIEIMNSGGSRPELVVGVPVGFVRAVESKALLAAQNFPYITNAGRKGGTPVAVAIVNALLKIAGRKDE
jgi:precorrin-8X/cobalt-precorrin-8 methylmutase